MLTAAEAEAEEAADVVPFTSETEQLPSVFVAKKTWHTYKARRAAD